MTDYRSATLKGSPYNKTADTERGAKNIATRRAPVRKRRGFFYLASKSRDGVKPLGPMATSGSEYAERDGA
jgi:hypothetical protein